MRRLLWITLACGACVSRPSPAPVDAQLTTEDRVKLGQDREIAPLATDAVARAPRLQAALPPAARRVLSSGPLPAPLLLPDAPELVATAVVTRGPTWIAAHMQQDGLTVQALAQREARLAPALAEELGGAVHAPVVTEAHGILSISSERFGAYYTLELECAARADARCRDDKFLRALYDRLAVAEPTP